MNDRFSADDLLRMDASARIPRPIDLAHTSPFRLGGVEVSPASREVSKGDRRELLEPLVMQVLIALHSARGEILSRDDLIDACWGGRAVTDDAINRVLSRLRALGRTFGDFEVETVTKVGYRLKVRGERAAAPAFSSNRRNLLVAGGAIAALGLVGFGAWRVRNQGDLSPEARLLLQKGMEALQNNDALDPQDAGSSMQAIALLTDATRAAPQSATAWGALSLAFATRKKVADLSERPGIDARARAAAKKALAIDPVEARALGALRLLDPVYRNWQAVERADLVAVRKNPNLPILLFVMSNMLGNVGRWRDAASYSKQLDRTRFMIPGADRKLILDLWGSGDLQAADAALDVAVRQWPQHPQIWRTRLSYLLYTGRAREVLAILRETPERPPELKPAYFDAVRMTAEALANLRPAADSIAFAHAYLSANPSAALQVAQAVAVLGDRPSAFEILDGYYFGEGKWSRTAPRGGDQDRITSPLFQPMVKPLWLDARFTRLLERIGLESYWRATGTTPDYRLTS